jgi:hypothetical protein
MNDEQIITEIYKYFFIFFQRVAAAVPPHLVRPQTTRVRNFYINTYCIDLIHVKCVYLLLIDAATLTTSTISISKEFLYQDISDASSICIFDSYRYNYTCYNHDKRK